MKRTIKIFALALAYLWSSQSCTTDFDTLNQDPKNPTETTMPMLFNGILSSLPLAYNEMSAIHNGRYYYQSQQLANAIPNYPITSGASDIWASYYFMLKNVRLLYTMIDEASATIGTEHAKAYVDIMLAYRTLRMVDYVGDMPFFDAGKGGDGPEYFVVKYDKQQDIYKHCIDLLINGGLALNAGAANQYSFGSGDTFLKDNPTMWKKFANSLALRYAMQLADADAATYAPIVGRILNEPGTYPVIGATETIGLWPNLPMDSHPWSYRENNNSCMGTTMWRMMSDNDNTDGSGIFDPRCYVFFEPNLNGEWKAYPQNPDENTPVQDRGPYLTSAYPTGRNKGATEQEWNNKGEGCRFSPVNFYLATNDDFIPEVIISVAEVQLLMAEAYNRGIGVGKDATKARAAYETGIRASMSFWYDQVVTPCAMWIINKPVLTQEQVGRYLEKMAYSADEATALKQIYAQIWVDSFRQPWVAFNLYRRTLATPRDESGTYNAATYNFYKVPYDQSEWLYNNANYIAGTGDSNNANPMDKKLFWHK
ncbi:MAG: SusD/RagB family nutrient-binding outer membrane lipoprotein [Tannerellaceae bacterium]|jgi:hypothetical protein|nr:SusD/RagB family nutrient-binding outer membrane lipoprotein [Tannerellaceae bacterium]